MGQGEAEVHTLGAHQRLTPLWEVQTDGAQGTPLGRARNS